MAHVIKKTIPEQLSCGKNTKTIKSMHSLK